MATPVMVWVPLMLDKPCHQLVAKAFQEYSDLLWLLLSLQQKLLRWILQYADFYLCLLKLRAKKAEDALKLKQQVVW